MKIYMVVALGTSCDETDFNLCCFSTLVKANEFIKREIHEEWDDEEDFQEFLKEDYDEQRMDWSEFNYKVEEWTVDINDEESWG